MNALFAATPQAEQPEAWLICDHAAQRRYGIGWAKPFPFPTRFYQRSGYLHSGATLAQLAQHCGIDAEQLQRTVEGFNHHAAQGEDPTFLRGASAYNRAQGDPQQAPNPSLRPLLKGPFHAVKLLPGSLAPSPAWTQTPQPAYWTTQGSRYPGCLQWVTTCTA